ncbi:MAG TPA: hypothetical protein VGU43_01205 [Thermoplasmata archaeon]|nr:hypothetical protein [Thermoplasmata archaeon]
MASGIILDRLSPRQRGTCWCSRPFYGSRGGVRFAAVPLELEFLRGRGFHSAPCAVAFLTDLARGLDRGLLSLGSAENPMEPARARPLLVDAIDAVLLAAPIGP